MHRRPLLTMLARYAERYPQERSVVDRIRTLVEGHADCFERSCRPGHVTASAWVTTAGGGRVLLVHHRKLNRWLQPGGHVDGDGDIPAAALREVREESALCDLQLVAVGGTITPLDLDVHEIPAHYDAAGHIAEDAHEHHDIRFWVIAAGDIVPQVSGESHDVRWFTRAELLAVTSEESVLRMGRKASGQWAVGGEQ